MSQKTETLFTKKVLADLRALPLTYAEKIQQKSIRGTPDIFACVNGWFIALEIKAKGGRADPLQLHVLCCVGSANGKAWVVFPDNWPAVLEVIAGLAHGVPKTN